MKRILLVLILTGSAVYAGAQVQFGVKAGYNLASLTLSPSSSGISSISGFNAGILASIPLFRSCYFQSEIVYSGQGAGFTDSFATGKLNYGYLNVPVLFKYQHASGLFAETGPQFGFLLSAKANYAGQSINIMNQTQSTDFAWVFGIGYKLPLGLGMDVRYNLGLTNITKSSAASSTDKNSVFQFGLFYLFPKL